MKEFIADAGKLAGSISAILALLTLVLWTPIKKRITKRKEAKVAKMQAIENERIERKDFERRVLEALDTIKGDIAELQRDRLCQAHDYYVQKGWCSPEKKRELCAWHDHYSHNGHDHLTEHYQEDILSLPDYPPEEGRVRAVQ